MYVHILIWSV